MGDDHNWSEEAFRIFEFDPATKVTVQRIRDIIHPDDLPSFEAVIARGMTGEDVTFAFRIVTVRGAVKHVRGIAHVIEQVDRSSAVRRRPPGCDGEQSRRGGVGHALVPSSPMSRGSRR